MVSRLMCSVTHLLNFVFNTLCFFCVFTYSCSGKVILENAGKVPITKLDIKLKKLRGILSLTFYRFLIRSLVFTPNYLSPRTQYRI